MITGDKVKQAMHIYALDDIKYKILHTLSITADQISPADSMIR